MERLFLYNKILCHCASESSPIMLGGLKIQPVILHFTKEKEKKVIVSHKHCFAELSWMLNGRMGYKLGNKLQVISSEDKNFIFIPPEIFHERISLESNTTILGFQLDLVPLNKAGEQFFDAIVKFTAEQNYFFENLDFLNEFELKLLPELNSGDKVFIGKINFYIYEFLFKLFSHYFADFMIRNCNAHKEYYNHEDVVLMVKEMVEERLSSSISLSFIAKKLNISTRHLNRIFSEQTGFSVGSYIIQRKLNASKKMLYNSTISVKEIAESLGFNRDAYFSHFFKTHTGMTPIEYSKQLNKN